jgi:hypothetical protein
MKKGPDALDTAGDDSGSAKQKNGTSHPQYRRKRDRARKKKENGTRRYPFRKKTCPGAQNMKTGLDALGTVENYS